MEEESGHLLQFVGDPAGGGMEEESRRDPSPLCHREKEKVPPCVSSPSRQLVWSPLTKFLDSDCGSSFEKDYISGTPRPCPYSPQFSYSPQWFPHLKPTDGLDDEETMMSCTLWNWSDDGRQTVSVETVMAGITMSNHAAAEPVADAAALSPLRPQNLQPMIVNLDFTTNSSKEASGPSPMGDVVAPMTRLPPLRPLSSCTSPWTEHILLPEASRSPAEASDATSVAMAEQGNVPAVEVLQSKEQSLLRIQTMMATGLLAQKSQGQLHVLLNFLEFWCTQPICADDHYAQAQHSGVLSSVARSNVRVGLFRLREDATGRMSTVWLHHVRIVSDILVSWAYFQRTLRSGPKYGTSHLLGHFSIEHEKCLDLCSQPSMTPQKKEFFENLISALSRNKERENEKDEIFSYFFDDDNYQHIELGNSSVEVQPGDMSRNHTDDMEVEPGDMPREPIVDMDVDSAKVKDVSQSNELYPLIEDSSSQVENIPGNFSMLDAAIGIKVSRQNEDKVKVASTQLMSWKRSSDINSFKNDNPRSGENGGDNELNEVDHKDVKVETGDASRKRKKCTSESKSEAWLHFTKVLNDSGNVVKGKCNHCGKVFKAQSKNGTSRLLRHAEDIHEIKLKRRSPKTKKRRVATTTKAKVAQPSSPGKVPCDVIMLDDSGDTIGISRLELQLLHRINSTPEQEVLVQINDVKIEKKELESLADSELEDGPPRYIRDDIIDAYIYILQDKRKDDTRAHGRVYIETTMGCKQLSYGRALSIRSKKNCGIKYLKHDMIFLPINQNCNHWYLAVINTRKQEVQVLDSITQFQEHKELKLLLKHIEQCLELASNEVHQSNSWPDYKLASWKVMEESQIPKQIDMSSCGLYVIKYMEYWTGEKMSRTFTQADIELFRLKLAAELMSSPLNKTR